MFAPSVKSFDAYSPEGFSRDLRPGCFWLTWKEPGVKTSPQQFSFLSMEVPVTGNPTGKPRVQ
jgi:hypothetical protein